MAPSPTPSASEAASGPDGVEVKASDFVYAWQRLADPATGSVYAPLLSIVSGYAEAQASGDMSLLAVSAKSSTTLVVTLTGHYDWFLRRSAPPSPPCLCGRMLYSGSSRRRMPPTII